MEGWIRASSSSCPLPPIDAHQCPVQILPMRLMQGEVSNKRAQIRFRPFRGEADFAVIVEIMDAAAPLTVGAQQIDRRYPTVVSVPEELQSQYGHAVLRGRRFADRLFSRLLDAETEGPCLYSPMGFINPA